MARAIPPRMTVPSMSCAAMNCLMARSLSGSTTNAITGIRRDDSVSALLVGHGIGARLLTVTRLSCSYSLISWLLYCLSIFRAVEYLDRRTVDGRFRSRQGGADQRAGDIPRPGRLS